MDIKYKITYVYEKLLNRLPSTYPNPKLIIHKDLKSLLKCFGDLGRKEQGDVDAYCDLDNNSIHITYPYDKEYKDNLIFYILHEIGHLYFVQRYGVKDKRWIDLNKSEKYADRFAGRWITKLKRENWLASKNVFLDIDYNKSYDC